MALVDQRVIAFVDQRVIAMVEFQRGSVQRRSSCQGRTELQKVTQGYLAHKKHPRGNEELAASVEQEVSKVSTHTSEVQRVVALVDQGFRGGACR